MAVVEKTSCLLLGFYIFYSLNLGDIVTSAALITISSGPTCECDSGSPTCRVGYLPPIGTDVVPVITWTNSNGTILKTDANVPISPDGSNPDLLVAVSLLSANDDAAYECRVSLSLSGLLGTIVPTFTASCNVSGCLSVNPTTVEYVVVNTTPSPTTDAVVQTTAADPVTTQRLQPVTEQASTAKATTPAVAQNCSGENLTNTVVYEGVPTSLSILHANNGQSVQWQVIPSSLMFAQFKNITNHDDNVRSEFSFTYAANQSHLIIFNSTVSPQGLMNYSTAGLYALRYRNPNCTTAANLIVIRSGPVCARNVTSQSSATLSCTVFFASSYVQPTNPVFKWTKSDGTQVKKEQPIPKQIDSYTRRSSSQLSIASTDTTTYECQLTFSVPPRSPYPYVAPTAPNFNASCSVSLLQP